VGFGGGGGGVWFTDGPCRDVAAKKERSTVIPKILDSHSRKEGSIG